MPLHSNKQSSLAGLPTVWDPVFGVVDQASVRTTSIDLEEQFARLQSKPTRPQTISILLWLLGVGLAVAAFLVPLAIDPDSRLAIAVFGFSPALVYYAHIHRLQTDLTKLALARQNGWLYSPDESRERWIAIRQKFPEIFARGIGGQFLTDQFWGIFTGPFVESPFWIGEFAYDIRRGKHTVEVRELATTFQL